MPSKLLIAAAGRAHEAKYSDQFGIHADVKIDGKQVMARVQAERNHFANSVKSKSKAGLRIKEYRVAPISIKTVWLKLMMSSLKLIKLSLPLVARRLFRMAGLIN